MDIIFKYLPLLVALVIGAFICSFCAVYTKHRLIFNIICGILALFGFCFLIYMGATQEELLIFVLSMLLPSVIFVKKYIPKKFKSDCDKGDKK